MLLATSYELFDSGRWMFTIRARNYFKEDTNCLISLIYFWIISIIFFSNSSSAYIHKLPSFGSCKPSSLKNEEFVFLF